MQIRIDQLIQQIEQKMPGSALSRRANNSLPVEVLNSPCVRGSCKAAIDFIAMVARVDRQGYVLDANPPFWQALGQAEGSSAASRIRDFAEEDFLTLLRNIVRAISHAGQWRGEVRVRRNNGTTLWADLTVTPERTVGGKTIFFQLIALDITAQKDAEKRAIEEHAKRIWVEGLLAEILDTIPTGIVACEEDGRVVFVNAAHRSMFRGDPTAADAGLLVPEGLKGRNFRRASDAPRKNRKDQTRPKFLRRTKNGRWVQIENKRSASGRCISVQTEVTSLKRAERRIREQATRDPLTGAYNRLAIFNRLDQIINESKDTQRTCALILLDVDNFKSINDTYGHDAGDQYLKEIAKRLTRSLRRTDTVARLGGDEFAVLLPGLNNAEDVVPMLEKMRKEIAAPLAIGSRTLLPSVSMGLASFPRDGSATIELMRSADQALYHCKHHSRGAFSIFDHPMRAKALRRTRLTEELRNAIAQSAFEVVLQPQSNLRTGSHHGFEALVRWRASGSLVPPTEIISIAEEAGLVSILSYGIIEKALVAFGEAKAAGLKPGIISFNTVASQLYDPEFPHKLRVILEKYDVSPSEVELEVTENVILDRSADLIAGAIRSLRHAGFSIALDDFGTGYASLTHLKQLPLDKLKIDRSFVSGITAAKAAHDANRGDHIISKTIVGLAHNLGFKVVAEGIETKEQFVELVKIGCDFGQGYLLSPPLRPAELKSYLKKSDRNLRNIQI